MEALSIQPILRIFDEAKAKEFYLNWLGFTLDFEHRFEPDTPIYMGISMGNAQIHLSEHYGDGTPHSMINIYCKGLRGYHNNLKPYKYYRPLIAKYQWIDGYIGMQVYDPFKNVITFLEHAE
ncbi:MAG: glyoxalase superfamily protein [Saprospiraceae bacterium]